MLSPIKTTPLLPSLFVSVGLIECVGAKGIYHKLLLMHACAFVPAHAHPHTPPPQSPLQLSNVKVVTQSNKSQTKLGLDG